MLRPLLLCEDGTSFLVVTCRCQACQCQSYHHGADKAQSRPSIVLHLDAVVIGFRRLCAQRARSYRASAERRAPRAFLAQSPVLTPFLLAWMTSSTRDMDLTLGAELAERYHCAEVTSRQYSFSHQHVH